MKRVMIVGQPGAGKSTLARQLGARTGLPVVHIDHIHWTPGWVEREREEKFAMMRAAERKESWIIEGGLSATWDTRLARADTVIVLDLPLALRLWRLLKRRVEFAGGQTRPDLPDNCPERFDAEFLKWVWDTRHSNRVRNRAVADQAGPGVRTVVLTSPRAVQRFLRDLDSGAVAGH
ncbi:Adenylate kinase [Salipiger thiooxidans]|uniref:Adenylate kinase n=1 Tax=Salipiger thiooxidans TaxID=282683 RepID=A0A1G7CI92_9RHOB|nr:AAA family ATPase [Salipiger thiooxidans]SDE39114.1 Adenylate kinase [Salipiger thiooxidans]